MKILPTFSAGITRNAFGCFMFSLLAPAFFLASCDSDDFEIEKVDFESASLPCLFQMRKDTQFVVKSEHEFKQMAIETYDVRRRPYDRNCIDTTQAPWDFEEYILLGKYTEHYTTDKLTKKVELDKKNETLLYTIEVRIVPVETDPKGYGRVYAASMNWIKVRRPPDHYLVMIEYLEK